MWLALMDAHGAPASAASTARSNATCAARLSATNPGVSWLKVRQCRAGEYTDTELYCEYGNRLGKSTASPTRIRPSGRIPGGNRGTAASIRSEQKGQWARVSSAKEARSYR